MAFLFCPSGNRLNIRAIFASDSAGVIGYDGDIVFHNPVDLAFFQQTTTGKICVMGRKTFESIGKILPKRQTVILSKHPEKVQASLKNYKVPDETPKPLVISNLEKELPRICDELENYSVFICGGAEILSAYSHYVSAFIVTKYAVSVQEEAVNEDATFIPYDYDEEKLVVFPVSTYCNLFCAPIESGYFKGVRYAIRTYRRGSSPQPTTITEQEKINRAKYRMEYKEIQQHELDHITKL